MSEADGDGRSRPLPAAGTNTNPAADAPPIRKIAAVILDGPHVLAVRKRGDASHTWMLPGGKPEPGETVPETLRRELREELDAGVASAVPFGRYEGGSALEAAAIRMEIFTVVLDGPPRAASEIAELRWIDCRDDGRTLRMGGALRDYVMPRLAGGLAGDHRPAPAPRPA